jgi:putative membrane protein
MSLQMLPWTWSFDLPVLLGLGLAAFLYALGTRYSLAAGMASHLAPWRWLCFAAGLLAIFLALQSPLDAWVGTYLWAHMVQHIILLYVAAPLLLFGAPLMPIWRAFPLESRRSSLRWLMLHPRPRRVVLTLGKVLHMPRLAWWLFVGVFFLWHTAPLYNLALRNQVVHDFEHLCFLGTALLFWSQVIPSAPLKPQLGYAAQAFYVFLAGIATEFVSMVLIYYNGVIYSYYAQIQRPAGAISAFGDQTAAAAIMNLTDVILYGSVFMVLLWRWIDDALQHDEQEGWPGTSGARIPPASGQYLPR